MKRASCVANGRKVPAGPIELTINNLPDTIIEESLRVSGRGSAQARLLGVDLRKIYLAVPVEAKQLDYKAALKTYSSKNGRSSCKTGY